MARVDPFLFVSRFPAGIFLVWREPLHTIATRDEPRGEVALLHRSIHFPGPREMEGSSTFRARARPGRISTASQPLLSGVEVEKKMKANLGRKQRMKTK